MNKAVTEGLIFTPPPFSDGLDVWSKGDGRPGTPTWQTAANGALVPSDGDFGACLEVMKQATVERVRHMGQTPIQPGCYLRISARVKAMSGNLPNVRIGAWAGLDGGVHATGLVEVGGEVPLTGYGKITEVSAIVGSGARGGVDMPWGVTPTFGHFGVEFTGPTGGIVRIENLRIEDVTHYYHRQMMDWVDVRDYGAVGDGVTDDSAAFELADAAAQGRRLLVPEGTYRLANHVTLNSAVRFAGTVTMADDIRMQLTHNFNLDTYTDAFGDEVLAFKKAFQAFLNNADHEALDLCGREINVFEPIDMHAAVGNQDVFAIRRVIRNGQFNVQTSSAWDDEVVTSQATYATSKPLELSNVTNIAQVPVGALIAGNGVGREVYVRSKNVAAGKLTLSNPLYDAVGTQTYTFTRFKYVLDFSGFQDLKKFIIADVDFRCNSKASAIMLAPDGDIFWLRDCDFTKPKDRAITSIGWGCQNLSMDRCNFVSAELNDDVATRTSIGVNVNANDAKVRNCRAVRFKHFMVVNGSGHVFIGNHWFQGDTVNEGIRTAGIVLTQPHVKTTFTGNYLDNSMLEWTNEHDANPDHSNEYSFGGLTIGDNIFTVNNAGSWFRFIVIKPYGPNHFIQGLTVTNNVFLSINNRIDRVEKVDDSIAPLKVGSYQNLTFTGNTFNGIDQQTISPVTLKFERASVEKNWVCDFGPFLPFGGRVRNVGGVVIESTMFDAAGNNVHPAHTVNFAFGPDGNQARVNWPYTVRGTIHVTARVDWPI